MITNEVLEQLHAFRVKLPPELAENVVSQPEDVRELLGAVEALLLSRLLGSGAE